MIERIHHIGIAVENLQEARRFFEENFNLAPEQREHFGELEFSFVPLNGTSLELLQSTAPDGVIKKFIEKKGTGVHHISFQTTDIQAELNHLKEKGIQLIHEKPYRNAHDELVAFIHPKSTYGILVELIQPNSH